MGSNIGFNRVFMGFDRNSIGLNTGLNRDLLYRDLIGISW
jgi:hypothetical protein